MQPIFGSIELTKIHFLGAGVIADGNLLLDPIDFVKIGAKILRLRMDSP